MRISDWSSDVCSSDLSEKLIFEVSRRGRTAFAQNPGTGVDLSSIPASLRRTDKPQLPEVSEMQTVRHFTRLSQLNFSIDTHFYPQIGRASGRERECQYV